MKNKHLKNKSNQRGLSLIELMISMVVGLFLLVGVVTNFVSTSKSDKMRDAVSVMDANAAYAMKTLRQIISHAGYGSTQNVRIDKPFFTNSDTAIASSACATSVRITEINNRRTKDSDDSDFLTVINLADNPCKNNANSCSADSSPNINEDALVYTDCGGGGATPRVARDVACSTDPSKGLSDPSEAKIYNTFRVDGTDRTLMCNGSRGGEQDIVDNVHAIQFNYGVRDEGTNSTAYRTATQVETADRWGQVRSVKVAILMRSNAQNLLKSNGSGFKYKLLDKEVVIPADQRKRLYRLYTSTINLENLNKEPLGEGT